VLAVEAVGEAPAVEVWRRSRSGWWGNDSSQG
jgi:hypothetical protein